MAIPRRPHSLVSPSPATRLLPASDPAGETLYIVIPEGAYTDVDIENFVVGLVDSGEVTYGAEIFNRSGRRRRLPQARGGAH